MKMKFFWLLAGLIFILGMGVIAVIDYGMLFTLLGWTLFVLMASYLLTDKEKYEVEDVIIRIFILGCAIVIDCGKVIISIVHWILQPVREIIPSRKSKCLLQKGRIS